MLSIGLLSVGRLRLNLIEAMQRVTVRLVHNNTLVRSSRPAVRDLNSIRSSRLVAAMMFYCPTHVRLRFCSRVRSNQFCMFVNSFQFLYRYE